MAESVPSHCGLFQYPIRTAIPAFSVSRSNIKAQVQKFWENSPYDSWFTSETPGGLAFYRNLDEHRYKVHWRLKLALGLESTSGLRVLEIGCGCGSEAELFARAGSYYTAFDLTNAAVSITRRRFQLTNLKSTFVQGDAENLPFADGSFDVVYSHGVLHHTPDTARTIREIHRVLCPGGRAIVMLYYRDSFNYRVNLGIVRRLRAHLLRLELGIKLARRDRSREFQTAEVCRVPGHWWQVRKNSVGRRAMRSPRADSVGGSSLPKPGHYFHGHCGLEVEKRRPEYPTN